MWMVTAFVFWNYEFGNYNAILTRESSNTVDVFEVPSDNTIPQIVRDILEDASAEKRLKILRAKTTLITYAAGCCRFATTRLCEAAVGVGKIDKCVITSSDAISPEFRKAHLDVLGQPRGGGYWAWKPYVILKHLRKLDDDDYLIYMDSGAYVIAPLHPLLLLLEASEKIRYVRIISIPISSDCQVILEFSFSFNRIYKSIIVREVLLSYKTVIVCLLELG
jgi:hypothetical protein